MKSLTVTFNLVIKITVGVWCCQSHITSPILENDSGLKVAVGLCRFVHPRFGPIKCIRTLRAVQKGEELKVAYGYDHQSTGRNGPEAPDWYKQELEVFQQTQAPPTDLWGCRTTLDNKTSLYLCKHHTPIRLQEHRGTWYFLMMFWERLLCLNCILMEYSLSFSGLWEHKTMQETKCYQRRNVSECRCSSDR